MHKVTFSDENAHNSYCERVFDPMTGEEGFVYSDGIGVNVVFGSVHYVYPDLDSALRGWVKRSTMNRMLLKTLSSI